MPNSCSSEEYCKALLASNMGLKEEMRRALILTFVLLLLKWLQLPWVLIRGLMACQHSQNDQVVHT